MPGKIVAGKDFNQFTKPTITNSSFPVDADVFFNFRGLVSFSLVNEGSGVIDYSFNGTTVHGDLTPGTPTAAIFFDNRRVPCIWFRLKSGAASVVRVEAWAAC